MEVFEAIRTILAVRKFQDKPVPDDLIHRVVESARLTASSRNGQPWQFIVIQERETLKRIGELAPSGPYTADAACAPPRRRASSASRMPAWRSTR